MNAIVEIAGKQFNVKEADTIVVPFLDGNPNDAVEFTTILAAMDGTSTRVGTPTLSGSVKAKIVEHGRGDKILVFKKRRRKGYQKMNGHRQDFTKIHITHVSVA
jgi:large subunit ribosomal protein L21